MKMESFFPSEGHMPSESEMNARPLPCEWPMNAICPLSADPCQKSCDKQCADSKPHFIVARIIADVLHQRRQVIHCQVPDRPICAGSQELPWSQNRR